MKTMFWIISLPTAGLIVGFITVLLSCYNLSDLIYNLENFEKRRIKLTWFIFFSSPEYNFKWQMAIYIILLVSGLFLIIGTIKKYDLLLLPWLIIMVFFILYSVLHAIFLMILSFFENVYLFAAFGFIFLISLSIYTWIGILTLHCNIYKENQTPTEADVTLHPHPHTYNVVKSSNQQRFQV